MPTSAQPSTCVFSEEHEALRDSVRRWVGARRTTGDDPSGGRDDALFADAVAHGFIDALAGDDTLAAVVVAEELGAARPSGPTRLLRHARTPLAVPAAGVASAWRVWEATLEYARTREAFGRPIGTFQANRHRLATVATSLTAARALVHGAAAGPTVERVLAAQLYAARVVPAVLDACLQLHGGNGYASESDVARVWQDVHAGAATGFAEAALAADLAAAIGAPRDCRD